MALGFLAGCTQGEEEPVATKGPTPPAATSHGDVATLAQPIIFDIDQDGEEYTLQITVTDIQRESEKPNEDLGKIDLHTDLLENHEHVLVDISFDVIDGEDKVTFKDDFVLLGEDFEVIEQEVNLNNGARDIRAGEFEPGEHFPFRLMFHAPEGESLYLEYNQSLLFDLNQ